MEDGFIVTKEDVIINYVPSSDVINYSYKINDNTPVYIESSSATNITLNEVGTYTVTITNNLNNGNIDIKTYKYVIDRQSPTLNIKEKTYVITAKDEFEFNVTAFDNYDGDITERIETNMNELDFKKSGIKRVNMKVIDSAGNETQDTIFVTVKKDNSSILYLGWGLLIIFSILLINLLYKYIKSIKYEKRFSKYSINNNSKSNSLFDNIYNKYQEFIDKYSAYLYNFKLVKKASKKYEKYDLDGIKFIFRKIVFGVMYIFLYIVLNLLRGKVTNILEMVIPFIFGYITLDIIYYFKFINYKKKVKNDLLTAITLLNNAFKAGRSIEQAINTVAHELDGPIALEFDNISRELSYGLDLDVAFKRFRDRIKLDEAVYLSASISVVNLTGGNIIKVFNSIEKTLYSKKKLNEELNALTSSSKFIMYVLIFVPVLFILFIGLLNKDYFAPLFTHPLGIVLILVEIILYLVYIYVVRKIMKIR